MNVDAILSRARRVYIDTNFVIYLIEGAGGFNLAAIKLWNAFFRHDLEITISQFGVAECLMGPFKRKDQRLEAAYTDFLVAAGVISLHPLHFDLLLRAARLAADRRLKLADAIHLQSAIDMGCDCFVTNDRDFRSDHDMNVIQLTSLLQG